MSTMSIYEDKKDSLLSWAQTFPNLIAETSIISFSNLRNFQKLIKEIDAEYFKESPVNINSYSARLRSWQTTWNKMIRYLNNVCNEKHILIGEPDFIMLARKPRESDVRKMLELALVIAVTSPMRQKYIDRIRDLDPSTQEQLMKRIQMYLSSISDTVGSDGTGLKHSDLRTKLEEADRLFLELKTSSYLVPFSREQKTSSNTIVDTSTDDYQEALEYISQLETKVNYLQETLELQTKALDKQTNHQQITPNRGEGYTLKYAYSPVFDQFNDNLATEEVVQLDPVKTTETEIRTELRKQSQKLHDELDRVYLALCRRSIVSWQYKTGKNIQREESWLSAERKKLLNS